jgi:hypothetical protein
MTTEIRHPLADEYLKRLRRAARRLPRRRRAELLGRTEAHFAAVLDPWATDPEALEVLERLGPPEALVAAELPAPAARAAAPAAPSGTREWAALLLLLFGGFLAGFGWLVGVILLWSSRAWSRREKWIGTLVVPGGLALPLYVLGMTSTSRRSCFDPRHGGGHCSGDDIVLLVVTAILVLAQLATSLYLTRRARRGLTAA